MEDNATIFWDKKINTEEAKRILKDELSPRFIEYASLLFARTSLLSLHARGPSHPDVRGGSSGHQSSLEQPGVSLYVDREFLGSCRDREIRIKAMKS